MAGRASQPISRTEYPKNIRSHGDWYRVCLLTILCVNIKLNLGLATRFLQFPLVKIRELVLLEPIDHIHLYPREPDGRLQSQIVLGILSIEQAAHIQHHHVEIIQFEGGILHTPVTMFADTSSMEALEIRLRSIHPHPDP